MKKSQKPSKKQMRTVLLESLFDPRETGATAALVEMRNPQYLCLKVQESLTALNLKWAGNSAFNKKMEIGTLISLLLLAKVQLSEEPG